MHADVLRSTGDPSSEESIAEALELLDAEPPGPELVAAHAGLAAMRLLGSSYEEAISAGARALALAAELALPEPARALGYRGAARCCLGDRDGLSDMRRAIQLAIEQGQGRVAAALHAGADAPLADARALFASMGYEPALDEIEALLQRTAVA